MSKLDSFRRHCRALQIMATGVFVCLALILAFPYLLFPLAHVAMTEAATASEQRQLLLGLVQVSPGICYLWALWAMRRALGNLVTGQLFQPTVARALRQIGGGVIAGAMISIFAVTNISRVIVHGRGGFADFDMSGIVLVMVGAALILFARLVDLARRLEAELDDMI
jgi:hypothetical protein